MAEHNILGEDGEQRAVDYLEHAGYTILHRNWKAPKSRHELDIVALDRHRLVVVEVKTRTSRDYGEPFDAVDWRKIRALSNAANSYVRTYCIDLPLRFDIIGIVGDELQHIKSAFLPPPNSRR